MDRKKIIYIGIILIITVITSITYFSYAFFIHKDEQHGKLNIVTGTLDYKIKCKDLTNNQIVLKAKTDKKLELKIKSLNSINSKYELYYETSNLNNITVKYSTLKDNVKGTINANSEKSIILNVINSGETNETITFKVIGGFINNDLALESGNSISALSEIKVTFDANGGSVGTSTKNVLYGNRYDTLPIPTRTGYQFKGWNGKNLLNLDVPASSPSNTAYSLNTNRTFTPNTYVKGLAYDNYYAFNNVSSLNIDTDSINMVTSSGYGVGFPLLSSAGKSYTLSYNMTSTGTDKIGSVIFYKSDGTVINYNSNRSTNSEEKFNFATPSNTYYMVPEFTANGQSVASTVTGIQLENGIIATPYEPYYISEDTKVTQASNHTLTAIWEDVTAPTLSLEKETYITDDFSGWRLENASIDQEGSLVLGTTTAKAYSGVYIVNGGFWYPTFDGYTDSTVKQGVNWGTSYYDDNMNPAYSLEGYKSNGWAVGIALNQWTNNLYWQGNYNNKTSSSAIAYKRYGPDVKKITVSFETGNSWSAPTTKVRNFKICGEAIPNSFYDILVSASDNVGVTVSKYAKGNQTKNYFKTAGTTFTGNKIRVTENGTYTVYVSDLAGNDTISTIEITNITN